MTCTHPQASHNARKKFASVDNTGRLSLKINGMKNKDILDGIHLNKSCKRGFVGNTMYLTDIVNDDFTTRLVRQYYQIKL